MDRRTTLNLFLGLLLATSLLAPLGQGVINVSTAHLNAVKNEAGQDANAPFGTWSRITETTTWYLKSDAPAVGVLDASATGDVSEAHYLDYERPVAGLRWVGEGNTVGSINPDHDDPNDKKIRIDSRLPDGPSAGYFVIPFQFTQTEDVRVYGVDFVMYVECVTPALGTAGLTLLDFGSLDLPGITGSISVLELEGGSWDTRRADNGDRINEAAIALKVDGGYAGTEGVYSVSGHIDYGSPELQNGLLLEAPESSNPGTRLQIGLAIDTDAELCVLHYDSGNYPSLVRITSDSGRMNTWTENRFGDFTVGLPAAARSSADQRRFMVQVAHAEAWPHLNGYLNPRQEVLSPCPDMPPTCITGDWVDGNVNPATSPEPTVPVDYMDDFWDLADFFDDDTSPRPHLDTAGPGGVLAASDLDLRIREMKTFTLVQGSGADDVQELEATKAVLGDSVNRRQYLFSYPATLPDGVYRVEAFSSRHGVSLAPEITTGLKGVTLEPLDGATHAVNPGEPTEFRFRVRNIGVEDDTYTISTTPPGNSWTAEIVGGGTQFLKANGGEVVIVLRVTPPSSATAGSSQVVSLSAASANFPLDVTPITRQVTVNVVSAVTRSVDVRATQTQLITQPGLDTALGGITVTNTGSKGDTFSLSAVIPSTVSGWTVQISPLSKEIAAGSVADFTVRVRAPADALSGQSFTLGLLAQRVGDSTVSDTINIQVSTIIRNGASITVFHTPYTVRDMHTCPDSSGFADDCATAADPTTGLNSATAPVDNDADTTPMFRVDVTNTGPVKDTFRIRVDAAGGTWAAAVGNATAIATAGFSTDPVTYFQPLAGGETRSIYVKLRYSPITNIIDQFLCDPCPSITGTASFVVRSGNDPGAEVSALLTATRTAIGTRLSQDDYTGGVHGVSILPDLTDSDALDTTEPGQAGNHLLRVVNTGNERDSLTVSIPGNSPSSGWTRSLHFLSAVPTDNTCTALNTALTRFKCTMFVGDEALFRLNVTPSAAKALGETDRVSVTVASGDNGNVSDSFEFITRTVGTFQFDARAVTPSVSAERNRTMFLPFVLQNLGTSGDTLNLSLVQGDPAYEPRLGIPASNFVPGGKDLNGMLIIQVPSDATGAKLFRLQVSSQGNGALDLIDFTVTPTAAGALRLAGVPSNTTTLPKVGVAVPVNVSVSEPGGTVGRTVRVDVLPGSMPSGWGVSPTSTTVTLNGAPDPSAVASFNVTAPANALANSRVPFLLLATSTSGSTVTGQGNLLLQLADVFGVKLALDGPMNQTIVPGGQVVYNMTVANLGTSTDTIRLTTSAAPTGWLIQTDPAQVSLGPLENRTVQLLVRAPSTAVPRALAATTLQALSVGSGATSSVSVNTQVGFYELLVNGTTETLSLAPTETVSRVYAIKNNGTVPDEVVITPSVLNDALGQQVTMTADPAVVTLEPNQTKEVRVDFTFGTAPPSDADIDAATLFASRLAPAIAPANVTLPVNLHVLPFVAIDADRDGINEYAIDRDLVVENGYEAYLDSGVGGEDASQLADLVRSLSESALAAATKSIVLDNGTTIEVVELVIDGDKDGRRDLFIDSTADGLPDHYWDPDGAKRQDLTVVKDVNGDGVTDYFVDTNALAGFDHVYVLATGHFVPLIAQDLDGDGTDDYVVDANENGLVDVDETVLYMGLDKLVVVQKIDLDGDGQLDDVYDVDEDGEPDYFVPAGQEGGIEIVLRDVNGDGVADWAYDADGDGRLDSYYDPVTGQSALIDTTRNFTQALKEYWFIGALFGVVLVLFVVLMMVTRK